MELGSAGRSIAILFVGPGSAEVLRIDGVRFLVPENLSGGVAEKANRSGPGARFGGFGGLRIYYIVLQFSFLEFGPSRAGRYVYGEVAILH